MKSRFFTNSSLAFIIVVSAFSAAIATPVQYVLADDGNNPDTQGNPSHSKEDSKEEAINSSVECSNLTTVIHQGDLKAVLFIWETKFFGPEYTPEKRCQIVSDKLNTLVQENNGKFAGIKIMAGLVSVKDQDYPVICSPKSDEGSCNKDNMLFTLKPENRSRDKVKAIIHNLSDPNAYGAETINESPNPSVDLGDWAKRNLHRKNSVTPVHKFQ